MSNLHFLSDDPGRSPRQRAYLAGVRDALRAADTGPMPDAAQARAELLAKLDETGQPRLAVPVATSARRTKQRWMNAAVGLGVTVAVLGTVIAARTFMNGASNVSKRYLGHAYSTQPGQQAVLTLGDQSRVVLAPQTTVRLAAGFGDASRTLSLVGEAFFDVVSESNAPFVVHTSTAKTRVLGTAFGIRHYAGDSLTNVAVVSGKVSIEPVTTSQHRLTLEAGDVAVASDSSAALQAMDDASAQVEWTRGTLSFKAAPLPIVLETLGTWYGYQFQLADSILAGRRITGSFDVNASAETLQLLRRVLRVTFTVQDSVIVVRSDSAHRRTPAGRASDPHWPSPVLEIGK